GRTDTSVLISNSGTYSIRALDSFSCSRNFLVDVTIKNCLDCPIYIPNAFTPNDDGLNDILKAKINCPVTYFSLKVFNRWGQKIFESNTPDKGWNGLYQNKKVPPGVYIYVLQYKNSNSETTYKKSRGTVVVIH